MIVKVRVTIVGVTVFTVNVPASNLVICWKQNMDFDWLSLPGIVASKMIFQQFLVILQEIFFTNVNKPRVFPIIS